MFAHVCTWSGLDKVSTKIQGLSRRVRTLQLSFRKVLKKKYSLVKVLPERLSSKGNIVGFSAQTQIRTALQNFITQTGKETLIARVDEIIWRDHEMKIFACNFFMVLIISQCLTKSNYCRWNIGNYRKTNNNLSYFTFGLQSSPYFFLVKKNSQTKDLNRG